MRTALKQRQQYTGLLNSLNKRIGTLSYRAHCSVECGFLQLKHRLSEKGVNVNSNVLNLQVRSNDINSMYIQLC